MLALIVWHLFVIAQTPEGEVVAVPMGFGGSKAECRAEAVKMLRVLPKTLPSGSKITSAACGLPDGKWA